MGGNRDREFLLQEIVRVRASLAGEHQPQTAYQGEQPTLVRLAAHFELSSFERDLVTACAARALDPVAAGTQITFRDAMQGLAEPHLDAISPQAPLRAYRLVIVAGDDPLDSPLVLDERVLYFLLGIASIDERLTPYIVDRRLEQTLLAESQLAAARDLAGDLAESRPGTVIQLIGSSEGARATAIDRAVRSGGLVPMFLRASTLLSLPHELDVLLRAAEREALLGRRVIAIEVDDSDPIEVRAARTVAERNRGIMIVSSRELLTLGVDGGYHELRDPNLAERHTMWRETLGEHVKLPPGDIDLLATQFALDSKQIARVVRKAARESELAPAVWRAAVVEARAQLDGLATRIPATATWSDLVLPKQLETALHEICDQLRFRHRVHEEWGLARGARRNTAITALFHGPSGTGKTLAAEVIATETGLDLYHIDLSRIVDKYVGETEKRLRAIFEAADRSGAILLFDEADALFGKRGDVERATDRWANLEVSYLLQRMETYRGLAILTTNAKAAVDTAFLRRLRFVLAFPFPDIEQRSELWRRIFPPDAPVARLDAPKLARLHFTGANIRGVALRAAFYAATDGGEITPTHLLRAARSEYLKLGIPFPETEVRGTEKA